MRSFLNRFKFSCVLTAVLSAGLSAQAFASEASPEIVVAVTGVPQVTIGKPVQFTASVANTPNTSLTWTVQGAPGEDAGTVSQAGVYTPPAKVPSHNIVNVVATSQVNPKKNSVAQVTILNPVPAITSATATPGAHGVVLLDVFGTNFASNSILQVGGYMVPSTVVSPTEITYTLTNGGAPGSPIALSVMNQSPGRTQSSVYALTVPAKVTVTTTGNSQVTIGQPVQYTAVVTGTTSLGVAWSVQGTAGENFGSISTSGIYTPPAVVPTHNVVKITATSQVDPTKSSSQTVTIMNPVPVITSATATVGDKGVLALDVIGNNFVGASVLQVGGYMVASTVVSSTEIKYTMTSPPTAGSQIALSVMNQSPGRTQSSTYAIVAPGKVAVSVTGNTQVSTGTPVQYTASVTGTTNQAVTWKVQGMTGENFGTVSSTGLFTPPAAVPVHNVVSITATSQVDSTKSMAVSATISNPVPSITSVTATPGNKGSLLLDVRGSNFISSSALAISTYGVASSVISPSEIQYTLTTAPTPGSTLALTVVNPSPGKTVSAVYSFLVPGSIGVTVSGSDQAIISTPVQYAASVTGIANTAVTWFVKGTAGESFGSISASGLYTPPAAVPVHAVVSIVATSQVDTTKSYTKSVTIANPVPTIVSATATPGDKGSLLVDVKGTNFISSSALAINTYGVASTVVSPTELKYNMTTGVPAAGTSLALSIVTPAPGKVVSSPYSLVVPGAIGVTVSGSDQATISTPVQYSASVTGIANTAVTWSLKGTAGDNFGSLSASGLYTPPAAVPVHVIVSITATSQVDTTKSYTKSVTIVNPVPTILSATATPGDKGSLLVDVKGTNFISSSALAINTYGVASTVVSPTELKYNMTTGVPAPGTTLALSVVIPAPGKVVSSAYNLVVPGAVSVTVTGATQATVSKPAQYTATVAGTTNTAVTWTVKGATGENFGSISSTGLYTPPASVPSHSIIAITATSQLDTSKTSTVSVSLLNNVPVITSGTTVASDHGKILVNLTGQNFLPTSIVEFQGTGLYTTYVSPTALTGTIITPQTAGSQVAVSVLTPNPGLTQSASFNVTLPGQVGVAVVGGSQAAVGATAQFFATVTGSPNTGVTWSLTGANDGASNGSISNAGIYTPPANISANRVVSIVATSVVDPTRSGSASVTVVGTSAAAAVRVLEQSSFGPTDASIAHVQSVGLSAYLDEQIATPATLMPQLANPLPAICTGNGQICNNENWWNNVITGPDQLRQRVAFTLGEIFVVSVREINGYTLPAYVNNLSKDAFGNWFNIMKDVTLSPAMGQYLNMVNSGKAPAGQIANENFARENLQLFNVGLNLLNPDGTLQTDSQGNPIPAYTEGQVEAFARAFTGWTWSNANGTASSFPNWSGSITLPLVAVESQHDTTAKVLLNTTLPAGQTAEQDVDAALKDVFNHPNVGPFVCQQLIKHLVKSNPSPAYVGRIAAVFNDDGNGVRGNMAAVVKALLLDEEARAGDVAASTNDGYLREPILWTANVLRGLSAVPKPAVTDVSAYTSVSSVASSQGEMVFQSPTVFNFFPTDWTVQGTGMSGPEFALETSATIMQKLTLANSVVDNEVGKLMVDLSATSPLGVLASTSNGALLDELNKLFLHGQMSSAMRSTISSTLAGVTDPAQRVRMAVYLVITSTQYKVIH